MLPSDAEHDVEHDDPHDTDELKFKEDDFQRTEPVREVAEFYPRPSRVELQVSTVEPPPPPPRYPFLTGIFTFPWYPSTMVTYTYLALGLTLAGFLLTVLFYVMTVAFTMGPMIGIPVGLLSMAVVSYASVVYLHTIEQTAEGYDSIEDWPAGGWREWFWSLPLTLGALANGAFVGWVISGLFFAGTWQPIAIVSVLCYPIFQLCVLDTGSPLRPFSGRVFRSLGSHFGAWFVFYAETLLLVGVFGFLCVAAFSWSPYLALMVMAPVAAAALLIYARLMGRLAGRIGPED